MDRDRAKTLAEALLKAYGSVRWADLPDWVQRYPGSEEDRGYMGVALNYIGVLHARSAKGKLRVPGVEEILDATLPKSAETHRTSCQESPLSPALEH